MDVVATGSGIARQTAALGLTLARAGEVAEAGVDPVSVGSLTHSVKVFGLGPDLS